jgi:hypothetical protein
MTTSTVDLQTVCQDEDLASEAMMPFPPSFEGEGSEKRSESEHGGDNEVSGAEMPLRKEGNVTSMSPPHHPSPSMEERATNLGGSENEETSPRGGMPVRHLITTVLRAFGCKGEIPELSEDSHQRFEQRVADIFRRAIFISPNGTNVTAKVTGRRPRIKGKKNVSLPEWAMNLFGQTERIEGPLLPNLYIVAFRRGKSYYMPPQHVRVIAFLFLGFEAAANVYPSIAYDKDDPVTSISNFFRGKTLVTGSAVRKRRELMNHVASLKGEISYLSKERAAELIGLLKTCKSFAISPLDRLEIFANEGLAVVAFLACLKILPPEGLRLPSFWSDGTPNGLFEMGITTIPRSVASMLERSSQQIPVHLHIFKIPPKKVRLSPIQDFPEFLESDAVKEILLMSK